MYLIFWFLVLTISLDSAFTQNWGAWGDDDDIPKTTKYRLTYYENAGNANKFTELVCRSDLFNPVDLEVQFWSKLVDIKETPAGSNRHAKRLILYTGSGELNRHQLGQGLVWIDASVDNVTNIQPEVVACTDCSSSKKKKNMFCRITKYVKYNFGIGIYNSKNKTCQTLNNLDDKTYQSVTSGYQILSQHQNSRSQKQLLLRWRRENRLDWAFKQNKLVVGKSGSNRTVYIARYTVRKPISGSSGPILKQKAAVFGAAFTNKEQKQLNYYFAKSEKYEKVNLDEPEVDKANIEVLVTGLPNLIWVPVNRGNYTLVGSYYRRNKIFGLEAVDRSVGDGFCRFFEAKLQDMISGVIDPQNQSCEAVFKDPQSNRPVSRSSNKFQILANMESTLRTYWSTKPYPEEESSIQTTLKGSPLYIGRTTTVDGKFYFGTVYPKIKIMYYQISGVLKVIKSPKFQYLNVKIQI